MTIYKNSFFILAIYLNILGCGGGTSTVDNPVQNEKIVDNTSKVTSMKAQLGALANADVKIFRLEENGSKTLLFNEKTSDGSIVDKIGNFDAHIESLKADKFYIYEVSGGVDKDVNDDGIVDEVPIENHGKIRLVSKGSLLKESKILPRVTLASEMLYVHTSKDIFHNYSNLEERLNYYAKNVLDSDIDGDGKIDMKDIVIFNPVSQKSALQDSYDMQIMSNKILAQDLTYMDESNTSYIIGSYKLDGYYMRDIAISEDTSMVYAIGEDYYDKYGLVAINIADKSKPKYYDNLIINIGNPYGITISNDGKKVFVADEYHGLQIVDSSNPESLKPFSSYHEDTYAEAVVLSKDNTKAFVSVAYGDNILEIVDINNLDRPNLIGSVSGKNGSFALEVSKDETKVFSLSRKNLQIIDVQNPSQPTIISELNTTSYIKDIVLAKDEKIAFITHKEAGISVIDINDVSKPKIITTIDARENPNNSIAFAYKTLLSKDEKKLFVSYYAEGLKIFDIQNPYKPKLIKRIKTPGYAEGFVLSKDGKTIYLADESKGLQIIDVSLWSGE